MPFTFSHPVLVLPLCKTRPFLFSAAVIGSMAPDFYSFLHLSTNVTFGHSPGGILRFCLPAGLAVFLLFHGLLKEPMASLLPEGHQRRLKPFLETRWPTSLTCWSLVILSLLLGVWSHLFLDSLTHRHGWMVLKFPVLAASLGEFGGRPLRVYALLQHGGGLAGMLVLFIAYVWWYREAPVTTDPLPPSMPARLRYAILGGMIFAANWVAVVYAGYRNRTNLDMVNFGRDAVLMGVPALLAAFLAFSVGWRFHKAKRPRLVCRRDVRISGFCLTTKGLCPILPRKEVFFREMVSFSAEKSFPPSENDSRLCPKTLISPKCGDSARPPMPGGTPMANSAHCTTSIPSASITWPTGPI
ncbi:MAG: DUF4184 family protein [Desulfococcaceae bacterium]